MCLCGNKKDTNGGDAFQQKKGKGIIPSIPIFPQVSLNLFAMGKMMREIGGSHGNKLAHKNAWTFAIVFVVGNNGGKRKGEEEAILFG
jgi:hypothetical protein